MAAAVTAFAEFFEFGDITEPAYLALQKLAEFELRLGGRLPYFLSWIHLANFVLPNLRMSDEQRASTQIERQRLDMCLGGMLLRATHDQLKSMSVVPALLDDVNLPHARMAMLYALGREDLLREEGSIPQGETADDVSNFFQDWVRHPVGRQVADHIELMGEKTVEFASTVLGMEVAVSMPNEPAAIHVAESFLEALEAFLATSLDEIAPYRDRLEIKIVMIPQAMRVPRHATERSDGELCIQIEMPSDYALGVPEDRIAFRDWLMSVIVEVISTSTIPMGDMGHFHKLADEEHVFDRALQFAETSVGIENVLGRRAKIRFQDWEVAAKKWVSLTRTEAFYVAGDGDKSSMSPEDEEKKLAAFEARDLSGLFHQDRRVRSVIDLALWDRARWSGMGFLVVKETGVPPLLGLQFKNEEAGQQIFEAWRKKYGNLDELEQIRVMILTGVDNKHPSFYRVAIGTGLEPMEGANNGKVLLTPSRSLTMEPETTSNLDLFLKHYEQEKKFGLCPAFGSMPSPKFDTSRVIGKTTLSIRPAWEIGIDDPDCVALRSTDDPIIPLAVQNAPVLEALAAMRGALRRRGRS